MVPAARWGNAVFEKSCPAAAIACTTARERGPAMANCAHWSATSSNSASSSGHSTWRQNSVCCRIPAALPVVVVMTKWSARAGRPCHRPRQTHPRAASPVARASDRQGGHGVDVEPVQQAARHRDPKTSILPSVETSQTPTALRTASASRQAACQPAGVAGRGKYWARIHSPASVNTAPCLFGPAMAGVRRAGGSRGRGAGRRARRSPPARRADGRRVVPVSATEAPVSAAMIASALTLAGLALVGRHARAWCSA